MFGSHRMKKNEVLHRAWQKEEVFYDEFRGPRLSFCGPQKTQRIQGGKDTLRNRIKFQTPDPAGFFWLRHSPIQGEATRDVVTACHCAQTYSTPEHEVIQLLSAWPTAHRHWERASSRRSGIRFRCSGETVTPEDLGLFYKSDIWVRVAIFFSWLWRVINVVSSFSLHNNQFL